MPQAREHWRTRDGWTLMIRPIGPGDEAQWTAFVEGLSPLFRRVVKSFRSQLRDRMVNRH